MVKTPAVVHEANLSGNGSSSGFVDLIASKLSSQSQSDKDSKELLDLRCLDTIQVDRSPKHKYQSIDVLLTACML